MKALRTTIAIACIAIIAVSAALIGMKLTGNARVADLTQYKLYELSGGTRSILAKLNQPVTLKLYYSRTAALKGGEDIRYFNNYYGYVRSLLEEYVRLSGGHLKLEVIDPRPFSNDEQDATQFGITRVPITEDEGFMFGLVATTELGKHKEIAIFQPNRQELVEYDISRIISELMQREKKTVGIISSLPVAGEDMSPYLMQMLQMQGQNPPQPWTFVTQLRNTYDVKNVQTADGKIVEKVDFLLVIHPKNLEQQALFAIDQYVMGGGQLMIFEDPYCIADQPRKNQNNPYMAMSQDQSSILNALTDKWGVTMQVSKIAADRSLAVSPGSQGGRVAEPLPVLMELQGNDNFNRSQPITKDLDGLHVVTAGVLTGTNVPGITVDTLLQTSPTGTTWTPSSPWQLRQLDGEAIGRAIVDGKQPEMLACALTGQFKTNFPQGIDIPTALNNDEPASKPADEAASQPASQPSKKVKHIEAVKEAAAGARVIVVSDVDMISDMMAYRRTMFGMAQMGGNAPFILNAIDYLSGSSDLISIRTRGQFARPFERVDRIQEQAAKETASQVEAIRTRLGEYEMKLRQLEQGANKENLTLVENQAIKERKAVEIDVMKANQELRQLQAHSHERVEQLGQNLQIINMVAAPGALLLIAIILAVIRYARARRYAARRAEQ